MLGTPGAASHLSILETATATSNLSALSRNSWCSISFIYSRNSCYSISFIRSILETAAAVPLLFPISRNSWFSVSFICSILGTAGEASHLHICSVLGTAAGVSCEEECRFGATCKGRPTIWNITYPLLPFLYRKFSIFRRYPSTVNTSKPGKFKNRCPQLKCIDIVDLYRKSPKHARL